MGVEYNGADFQGWQTQAGSKARTVQTTVETAISTVANHPISIYCAGRTDAGVHAVEQVIHFDTNATRSSRSWIMGSNANLPSDINIKWAQKVTDDFHARFRATGRHYRYIILNRPIRSALEYQKALWIHYPLDETTMQTAALDLIGKHDFSSYRAAGCQAKNSIRTVKYLNIKRSNEFIFIEIGADAFLYHMVRNIVGVLITIGRGDKPISWAFDIMNLKNRALGGITAPPQGLYLIKIDYPSYFGIPVILDFQHHEK